MQTLKKYGSIRAQISGYTSDSNITIGGRTRSFTFINQGTTNIDVDLNGNSFILSAGDSITFGGYDDSTRSEDISISFIGAGTNKLVLIRDMILALPNYKTQ